MPASKVRLTPKVMGRLRLVSQGLLGPGFGTVPDAVRWMTAMQAQDLASGLWAIGQRVPGSGVSDVRAAIDAGTVVRSWPLRGTLHLLAPEDLRWILGVTSARMLKMVAPRHRELGITDDDVADCRRLASKVTAGGAGATREELFEAFEEGGQITKAQRGVHLIWSLCQRAWFVQGPMAGTDGKAAGQQLFMPFEEWITESRGAGQGRGHRRVVPALLPQPRTGHGARFFLVEPDPAHGSSIGGRQRAQATRGA